jgi:hypothetical protein
MHPSKELALHSHFDPPFVVAEYYDLTRIGIYEYLEFLKLTGDFMVAQKTGRLLADFSQLTNFPQELRAAAINNFRQLIADRIPYLLLAIVKPKEIILNPTLELAVDVAKPLSRKFLDGQTFLRRPDALNWLLEYPVNNDMKNRYG